MFTLYNKVNWLTLINMVMLISAFTNEIIKIISCIFNIGKCTVNKHEQTVGYLPTLTKINA